MYRYYNPNPCARSVGDCAVRAIAAAFDIPWDQAFDILAETARNMCDMPSSDAVWSALLRRMGFVCEAIQGEVTVGEYAEDHPRGVYVLGLGGHVVTVVDGTVLDTWDSTNCPVIFVWKRDRERRRNHV